MGKEIIKSVSVGAGTRVYHFDKRADKNGSEYFTIAEVSETTKERNCINIWPQDIGKFRAALDEIAANVIKS